MEDAFRRQADIHDLRNGETHERQKDALHGLAHPCVFHGGLAHHGGGKNRVLAVRDRGQVEDRILVGHGVEAGVVAEGTFGAEFADLDVALQHVLGMRGYLQIHSLALHQFQRRLAQEAGNQVLLNLRRRGYDGAEGRRGIRADGDCNLHALAANFLQRYPGQAGGRGRHGRASAGHSHQIDLVRVCHGRGTHAVTQMLCRVFLPLPMHAGRTLVVHLHAIHTHVALAGFRVTRDHQRQRDVVPAISRPCFQNRQAEQVDITPTLNHFLAGRGAAIDHLWKVRSNFRQHGQHLQLVQQPGGHLRLQQRLDPAGDVVQRIRFQRHAHTAFAAKLVHQHACPWVAFHLLKQQRRPASLRRSAAHLRGAVGNLRHLQHWVHLDRDALQFTTFVELLDPVTKIAKCHADVSPKSACALT